MNYELRKTLNLKVILFFMILFILHFVSYTIEYKEIHDSHFTSTYSVLGKEYEGAVSDAQLHKVTTEYETMNDILGQEEQMRQDYFNDSISYETYQEYRNKFHYYNENQKAIEALYKNVSLSYEKDVPFLIDSYYQYYLDPCRIPWCYLLSVLFVIISSFSYERRQLLSIIHPTFWGAEQVRKDKIRFLILFSIIVGSVYYGFESAVFYYFDGFHRLNYPLKSILSITKVSLPPIPLSAGILIRYLCYITSTLIILLVVSFIKKHDYK